ncbi:hypothetical protein RI103_06665 [Paraburkholderia sp. FT54]|uniref:hypothetical protein n=1 Tax=Paraburkholderia sp. FT54 TaxID=3074437 RepID=UPI002877258C|nr:hypothetical protein [Paraburkholderia sp. FT54]WNC91029.1 hypothetical protein RI103_06665 [Paraburkholderia sp. FT54]
MKIRILSITCVVGAAALLAACTAVYKNTDACEQLMRSKLAETSPDTLKITHAGAGIHGARVVVEGSIEHVGAPTSAPSAASAPLAASGARAASAVAVGASGARTASAVAVGASGARPASAVAVGASAAAGASGAANASATAGASAASATAALSLKPAKPRKTVTPAAAECTFHGPTLNIFSWLAPANLVTPATNATE